MAPRKLRMVAPYPSKADRLRARSTGWLVWGVTPSLVAWVALLLNPAIGLWLVAAGLWTCFVVDRLAYPKFGVRAWLPMRLVLTMVASLSCIAGAMGAMR